MGKIRTSGLGVGTSNMVQTSFLQSNYSKKVDRLAIDSIYLKNNIYPHKLPINSIPNSTIEQRDEKGQIVRIRHYDEYGNAYKDVDYTDHGRPDIHKVPHTHEIKITDIIERKKGVLPNGNNKIYKTY